MAHIKAKGRTIAVSEKAHKIMKQKVLDSKDVKTIREHINVINGLDKGE